MTDETTIDPPDADNVVAFKKAKGSKAKGKKKVVVTDADHRDVEISELDYLADALCAHGAIIAENGPLMPVRTRAEYIVEVGKVEEQLRALAEGAESWGGDDDSVA